MTRRLTLTLLVIAGVATIPALAALMAPRAVTPAMLSLNLSQPAFAVGPLVPGTAVTRCLRVRNEGDAAIGLVEGVVVSGPLAPYLRVTAERGTGLGDAGPSCAGFAPTGGFAYGTRAGGTPAGSLRPDYVAAWPARDARSLRVTIALPADAPNEAQAKAATVTAAFAGFPIEDAGDPTPTPDLPGGIAPGTTGGFDMNGNFLTNAEIKRRLRVGRARMLRNGDVAVKMFLPAGGAIRAKVYLPSGRMYAHTLLPEEWGPNKLVIVKRRQSSWRWFKAARRQGRRVVGRVTTRYRWAHGPNAFVQPEQKLVMAKRKRSRG